ncbi:PA2169 family four-helix-bundle protein [Chitinophaga silvatica]|nr:PA2169 family four-helix-bundle protein [Chitinophaga silvatica]
MQEEKIGTVLNDLVKINEARIIGYEKAMAAIQDEDEKALFQQMIEESKRNIIELHEQMLAHNSGDEEEGKVYRAWTAVRSPYVGDDRSMVFTFCEYGEDTVQFAYSSALHLQVIMPFKLREVLAGQQAKLKEAHDTIKSYKDVLKD